MSETLQEDRVADEAQTASTAPAWTKSIVVADRGHVWVGHVDLGAGEFLYIGGAQVIRRWGTKQGLNELAVKGPQPNTILDATANVLVARRAVIAIIPCEQTAWTA